MARGLLPTGWRLGLLPAHLRGQRLLWVYVLIAAIALSAVVHSFILRIEWRGAGPGLDFRIDRRGCAMTASSSSRVDQGDCLLAVDGIAVDGLAAIRARLTALGPRQQVDVVVRRSSGATEAVATRTARVRSSLPLMLAGICWLAVALALLWFVPRGGEILALYLTCFGTGINFVAYGMWQDLHPLSWASFWVFGVGRWMTIAGPVGLALLYPFPLRIARRWPLFEIALLSCIVLGVLDGGRDRLPFVIYIVCQAATMVLLLATMVWRSRMNLSPRIATQLRLASIAYMFVISPLLANTLQLVMGPRLPDDIYNSAFVLMAGSAVVLAHGMIRRNMLSLDKVSTRLATYGGMLFVGVVLFALVGVLAPAVLLPDRSRDSPLWLAGSLAVSLLVLVPVARALKPRVDDYFHRHALSHGDKIRAMHEAAEQLAFAPVQTCHAHVERVLREVLGLDRVALLGPAAGRRAAELASLGYDEIHPITGSGIELAAVALTRSSEARAAQRTTDDILAAFVAGAAHALAFRDSGGRLGRYKLVGYLGAGGMGAVYLGVSDGSLSSQQKVAIKLARVADKAPGREPLQRQVIQEAQLAKQLLHPSIVQLHEVGEVEQGTFMAFEYVEGCDGRALLAGLARDGKRLEVDCAVTIARSLLSALAYAHAGDPATGRPSLIHRDVSPDNLLIAFDGTVKLADFGVAVLASAEGGPTLAGKPDYMAPEALRREPITTSVDVYAAGVVLYELLLGEHPYRRQTFEATVEAAQRGRSVPIHLARQEVSAALSEVVSRAMAGTPEERHASSAAMLQALERSAPVVESAVRARLGELALRYGASARAKLRAGPSAGEPTVDDALPARA